jgi:hypothetical protein
LFFEFPIDSFLQSRSDLFSGPSSKMLRRTHWNLSMHLRKYGMLTKLISRVAAILAMAFWWGGLTFYALIVVPTGVEVLGGETEQGFVTRQVSNSINLAGIATLVILLWSASASWRDAGRRAKAILVTSWVVMAGAQAVLLVVHPRLDAMLDAQTHTIADPSLFHPLHEFYLTVTGVQWFAGLLHLLTLMTVWQSAGRVCPPDRS